MKIYSTIVVISKMKTKTTRRYYYIPARVTKEAKKKNPDYIKC